MSVGVSRDQVVQFLKRKSWRFNTRSRRGHTEIFRQIGTGNRISVPRHDVFTDREVAVVLQQAGFTKTEYEQFMRDAVKAPN